MGLPAPQANNSRMTRPVLVITSLCKSYVIDNAEHRVLADISLEAHEGEFLCIVGPSGAGKTTLLRCIAGLISPSSGTVTLDGSTVTGPPEKLGVVFQDYSRSLVSTALDAPADLGGFAGRGAANTFRHAHQLVAGSHGNPFQ